MFYLPADSIQLVKRISHFVFKHIYDYITGCVTAQQPAAPSSQQGYGRRPGSINDYDPMTGTAHTNSPYSSKPQSTTVYNSQQNPSQGMLSMLSNCFAV